MVPADPEQALEVRFIDGVFDHHIQSNQQRIIDNALRPEGDRETIAVAEARPYRGCSPPGAPGEDRAAYSLDRS
jgi:hypothetical protein